MGESRVSEEKIFRFILDNVDSIPQMEALLLLWRSRPQQWSEEQLAARIYVDVEDVPGILQDLVKKQLITGADTGSSRSYCYELPSEEMDQMMQAVAETYGRDLIRVSKLIHSKSASGIREFARAFKFTKERE
jgi:hypothetical protein